MNAAMQTSLNTFRLNDQLFARGVATIDNETAHRRIAGDVNPIIWMAGHLLNCRKYLLDLFGEERELPNESRFREKYDPDGDYPSMAEITESWTAISSALFDRMEQASDDHFEKEIDWNLPNNDKTVRGAILFYLYHEAYHLGQIGYALRGMDKDRLVPY